MKLVLAGALGAAAVFLCACCLQAQTYEFDTIAGLGGTSGTTDGDGLQARFRYPSGLVVATNGNVYVSDSQNHAIRCVTPDGGSWSVRTIAGVCGLNGIEDGTSEDARFNRPTGITIDAMGNLYVTDRYSYTIRMLAAQGTNWSVETIAGAPGQWGIEDGEGPLARFAAPFGIVAHPNGNLFVTEGTENVIRMLTRNEDKWQVTTVAGTEGPGDYLDGAGLFAGFTGPHGLAVDHEMNLIVTDWGNHAIRKITGLGADYYVSTLSGFTTLSGSQDGAAEQATFYSPDGVAVQGTGDILIADQGNHTIRKLAPVEGGTYTVSTLGGTPLQSGTADGVGSAARFNKPWALGLDGAGAIYIADYNNHTVRRGKPATPAGPKIKAWAIPSHIVLSWRDPAGEYKLEISSEPGANAEWLLLDNQAPEVDGFRMITNAVKGGARFYRLRRQ